MYCVETSAAFEVAHSGDWIRDPEWCSYDDVAWNSEPYLAENREAPVPSANAIDEVTREFDLLKPAFEVPRGDEEQEAFFYSAVKPFLLRNGALAIRLLDVQFQNNRSVVASARYHLACLLGHLDDPKSDELRRHLLAEYQSGPDDALRAGAQDALDFLSLL